MPNKKQVTLLIPRQPNQYKMKAEAEGAERVALEKIVHDQMEVAMRAEVAGKNLLNLGELADSVSNSVCDRFRMEIATHPVPEGSNSITAISNRVEKQIYNALLVLALLAQKHDDLLDTVNRSTDLIRSNVTELTGGEVGPEDFKTFSEHLAAINSLPSEDEYEKDEEEDSKGKEMVGPTGSGPQGDLSGMR